MYLLIYQLTMLCARCTCISHDLAGNFLVAATATEYLATYATVMPPTKGCEAVAAVVTLLTVLIRHPVLAEITVAIGLRRL